MRYSSSRTIRPTGNGRKVFFGALISASLLFAVYFVISPPSLGELKCERVDPTSPDNGSVGCGCPDRDDAIRRRNVLIIDTTDSLRDGKVDDIERLISAFGTSPLPLLEWLSSGKKTDMTSIFVLADKPVADMRPLAKFCSPPPRVAQQIGATVQDINALARNMKARTSEVVLGLHAASNSSQSPIVETLATIVRSSSHWSPGSTLILASDLIENSPACGWFEKLPTIPSLNSVPSGCDNLVRTLQEGLRPNQAHPDTSVVAFCTLPGKSEKPGLRAFWSDISKGALQSDALFSCDPAVILARREFLSKRAK